MDLQTHPLSAGRASASSRRRIAWALIVSGLAHVLLLWPSATPIVRPLLRATLRPGPVPVAPVPTVPPTRASDGVASVRPDAAAPVRRIKAQPKAAPDVAASAASEVTAASPSSEPAALASVVDAESLRSYRISLALNARRFHRYPPDAIEQGLAGTAQVRILVAQNGLPGRVDLMRSSGHETLDREARDMLARAAQATALPDALQGHAFAVELPVEFSLPAR